MLDAAKPYLLPIAATAIAVVAVGIAAATSFERSFDYRGKHVFITGGSSGIGFDTAKEYLRRGANVTLAARDITKLKNCQKLLENDKSLHVYPNQRIEIISVDLSGEYEVISKTIEKSMKLGPVSVLVNAAGTSYAATFDKTDIHEFERMLRVNYLSAVYATRSLIEGMKSLNSGRIVFVSSQVGQIVIHGYTAYGASKWALRGLAEGLQMELKPYNIYVSVSYPPDTDTEGYKEEMKTKPALTAKISESGTLFNSAQVAKDIVDSSTKGRFAIYTGLDGFLLSIVTSGMSPVNSLIEFVWQISTMSVIRAVSFFYLVYYDKLVADDYRASKNKKSK